MLLWFAQGLGTIGRWTRAGGLVLALPIAASLWWTQQALVHRARATTTDPILYFRQDVLHDVDVIVARAAEIVPAGAPVLVSRYSAYAFQVYARGRLAQAAYCKVYCFDEEGFVRGWLAGITDTGWVILTDEDTQPLTPTSSAPASPSYRARPHAASASGRSPASGNVRPSFQVCRAGFAGRGTPPAHPCPQNCRPKNLNVGARIPIRAPTLKFYGKKRHSRLAFLAHVR